MTTDLQFDPTGCQVAQVKWPARGFQMILAGETAEGRSAKDIRLTFEAVANQYELREFLSGKRRIERKGGLTRNTIDTYPLKLPATLTHLKPSKTKTATYGDSAFTDAHGKPPPVGPEQQLYLFALEEKRFKDRKPFPIIFSRLTLADRKGILSGAETPQPKQWSRDEYHRLGMRFFEAVVTDDLTVAREMLSASCRRRLGKADFARRLGECRGCARRFEKTLDELRPHLYVNVEDDSEVVWESVQRTTADFPRESARAQLELCSEMFRESLLVYVVEENGEPRIDMA